MRICSGTYSVEIGHVSIAVFIIYNLYILAKPDVEGKAPTRTLYLRKGRSLYTAGHAKLMKSYGWGFPIMGVGGAEKRNFL